MAANIEGESLLMVMMPDESTTVRASSSPSQKANVGFVSPLDSHSFSRSSSNVVSSFPFSFLRSAASIATITTPTQDQQIASLQKQFKDHSGAALVFVERELAPGKYYDKLPTLEKALQIKAAEIAVREVKKYPPGLLKELDLKTFGIFAACISLDNDGFHAFDNRFGGYRWYGLYNMEHGVVGAFYTEAQLPLTIHHEIFHVVDNNLRGVRDFPKHYEGDDAAFSQALRGERPYAALEVSAADLQALKQRARGVALEGAVSAYSQKEAGEDQAETWRWVMTNLPDALVQCVERPRLPGSQRILHVISEFSRSRRTPIELSWLVDVALERTASQAPPNTRREERAMPTAPEQDRHVNAAKDLQTARALLHEAVGHITDEKEKLFVRGSASDFTPNLTLQDDIRNFSAVAYKLAGLEKTTNGRYRAAEDLKELVGVLDAYHGMIERDYKLSESTRGLFGKTRDLIVELLPHGERTPLRNRLLNFHYLNKINKVIEFGVGHEARERRVERNLRSVVPSTVWCHGASGVNLSPDGLVITNAHVINNPNWEPFKDENGRVRVQFPNGELYWGEPVHVDTPRDLALVRLHGVKKKLPAARIAKEQPPLGTPVVFVGQPAGWDNWRVSAGTITEYKTEHPWKDNYPLGGVVGNWWSDYGNSGSGGFNEEGDMIVLHNSWDERTRLRHGVPHKDFVAFLREAKVSFEWGK